MAIDAAIQNACNALQDISMETTDKDMFYAACDMIIRLYWLKYKLWEQEYKDARIQSLLSSCVSEPKENIPI
jgi:hypothetical protein